MMLVINNSNRIPFLVSSILVVPLIVQLLIISQSFSLIDCLSLTELHSTLSSNHNINNNRFKSRLSQEKSIRDAIRNLNHLHHQKLANSNRDSIINSDNHHPQLINSYNNYELTDDIGNNFNQQYLPVTNDDYDDDLTDNYLIVKSPTINGINKRQDEVVMDIPLEYTSDIPYEFYPELWPSNQQRSPSFQGKIDDDDLKSSDKLSLVLAAKIANLLESESGQKLQRKRVLVKRNYRSGLGSPSNGGNHHHGRSSRLAPNLSTKSKLKTHINSKPMVDSKHRSSSGLENGKDSKVTLRKLGDTKKIKLNRIPLKSTLVGHQPVKGDFAKLVNGKAVHVTPMMIHSKVINSTVLGHKESDKSEKKPFISKNFRKIEVNPRNRMLNLNRKDKSVTTNPLNHQSSMKEFFNEIDLPKGPKNIVKRSISSQSAADLIDLGLRRDDDTIDVYNSNINVDDDLDDGDDSVDGNNNGRGEDDLRPEINEGEYRSNINQSPSSSSPMVLQSNPWLLDEATRTLMRSLTVKRRKRGNNEDDQLTLIGLDDDDDEVTTSTSTTTTTSTSTGDKDNDDDDGGGGNIITQNNDDQLRINEIDEPTSTTSGKQMIPNIIEFENEDETPARIVKKDGATLTEGHPGIDEDDNIHYKNAKRLDSGLISNGSQLKSTVSITSLVDGLDSDGDNETFLEEDFSEGLISIGDDLDKINKSISLNSLINDGNDDDNNKNKRVYPIGLAFSSSSTLSPMLLTNGKVDQIDDQIANGSVDSDDQLLMDTINKGLYVNNKRKRSVTGNPYFDKVGQESSLPVSFLVAQEEAKFIDVDDKLERIEETLILEALDLIKSNLNGQTGQLISKNGNIKPRIESRLNAAYDLEDMRLALTDLHKIIQKMSTEDGDDDETILDGQVDSNNDHGNEINDEPIGQEVFLDSIDKLSISDDDEQDVKGDTGIRNKDIGHLKISPTNLSPFNNHRHPTNAKSHHLNPIKLDECPAVQALTTDCSIVKDVVPYGPLQMIFRQSCNWHEVCYSCGELFGLLSSDCDMGFLEQSRLACNDSASCETASRLILMPLKSRRIFYKQKVPSICYQQHCVENFLLKSKRKR